MKSLSPKWRGFLWHLGPYLIIIGMLGVINLMTTSYPWVIWPALGWGVGLVIHLWTTIVGTMTNLSGKWRGFLWHLGPYLIIISLLGMINTG